MDAAPSSKRLWRCESGMESDSRARTRYGIMEIDVADTLSDGWRLWLTWQQVISPENATEIAALKADHCEYLGYIRVVGRRRADAQLQEPIVAMPMQHAKRPLLRYRSNEE